MDKMRVFALQIVVFLNKHGCVALGGKEIYKANEE
jgi:hypothetical protein